MSRRIAVVPVDAYGYLQFPTVPITEVADVAVDGFVNVDLEVGTLNGDFSSWEYSVEIPTEGTSVSLGPSQADLMPPLSGQTTSLSGSSGKVRSRVSGGQMVLHRSRLRSVSASGLACNESVLTKTFEPWVAFAVARSDKAGVTAKYSLSGSSEKTVSSSLGVAVRDNGGLTIGGRQTHQSAWSTGFAKVENSARQYETKWLYGTWQKKVCLRGGSYYHKYTTQPIENLKDTRIVTPGGYSAPYCIDTVKGQWWEITRQRNVEWSQGAQLRAVGFEANLSAQTGYSAADKLRFDWTTKKGQLCGQFAKPANDRDEAVGSVLAR